MAGDLRPDLERLRAKLDAMPDRAVILDEHGDAWQKSLYLGLWYRAFDGEGIDSYSLMGHTTTARPITPEGTK